MRTLLVDNYDSFTRNLFHYLAEVNGVEPVVVENDDPALQPGLLDAFDNVVFSPGPGHPERSRDFGRCAEIIRTARIPLLGVCLGHQGIAAVHGGTVGRAPEPWHGRTCVVRHDGTGLFAGLPSPLEVVRYHSLAVTALPAQIEALAWAPDGVVMALRHTALPQWGVQFHPESIGTLGGHTLLRNFAALTRDHQARTGRPPVSVPAGPARREPQRAGRRRLRVLAEQVVTDAEPEVLFDRLFRAGPYAFWLDGGATAVLGNAAGPLARVAIADVTAATVQVSAAGTTVTHDTDIFDWLDADLRGLDVQMPDLAGDYALGWLGYLGYELKAHCGGTAAHRAATPDAVLVFADRGIVIDHRTGTAVLLALAEDGDETAARAWLRDAAATLADLAGVTLAPPVGGAGELRLRHDRTAYLELIEACQEEIRAGETYEVCLTNLVLGETDTPAWDAYRRLRRDAPGPYGAYLNFGGTAVLSTSPERFLRVGRDRVLESRPIKGTRPRGRTDAQDALLVADLATNEKDRAENLMIVDLVRHDLGRYATVGTVTADPVFQVETYAAAAHQLVSTVRAELRPGASAVDAVRAAFPPGSMTGAPKIRTMEIIDRLEGGPRGVYSGAIGYFSLTGAADLSVVIRTLVLTGRQLSYGVGGAIIALSDPDDEYAETAVKAAPLLSLFGSEFPGGVPADSPTRRSAR